jgi:NAD(P)-dependent dehydrogenase (short-subunit alcohol dehydrogenase family)
LRRHERVHGLTHEPLSSATTLRRRRCGRGGAEHDVERADVTDEQAVEALMQRAVDEFGALDVVFCNAGSSDYFKRPHEVSLDEWEDVIATNLTSVFLCAKHAVRHMLPTRSGKLVLTASIWGVINLTRELAVEYANDGLTVNALSPGFFSTNIGQDKEVDSAIIDRLVDGALRRMPTGRIMDPDEIKGASVFLASRASDALNGHVLTVDGGLLAA